MDRHALFLHIIARLKAVYAYMGYFLRWLCLLLPGNMFTSSGCYDFYIRKEDLFLSGFSLISVLREALFELKEM